MSGDAFVFTPGEVVWRDGFDARDVVSTCPHTDCGHGQRVHVAFGPSFELYALVQCEERAGGCRGMCRAWVSEDGRVSDAGWSYVGPSPEAG